MQRQDLLKLLLTKEML